MLPARILRGRGARRLAACAAAAGSAVLLFGALGAPAKADPTANFTDIHDYQTGLCLDSNNAGDAYTLGCNSGTYQNWYAAVTGLATDAITLQDAQTRRCLDSNYAGAVYTSPCDSNNTYENWIFYVNGSLGVQFQDLTTGRCLDSNSSGNLYTSPCNYNNTYQNWAG